jgi:hypothetical protein
MSPDIPGEPENVIAAAIDAAEEIRDPLEGLIAKTGTDPGAPFAPHALVRLTALKKDDRAAFEALRAQLKKVGCRVTALDEAIAEEDGDTGGADLRKPTFWSNWRSRPSCSTPRTAKALPTLISTATGKRGRSAPRAFAVGSRAASSRRRKARRVRRRCNRR